MGTVGTIILEGYQARGGDLFTLLEVEREKGKGQVFRLVMLEILTNGNLKYQASVEGHRSLLVKCLTL